MTSQTIATGLCLNIIIHEFLKDILTVKPNELFVFNIY